MAYHRFKLIHLNYVFAIYKLCCFSPFAICSNNDIVSSVMIMYYGEINLNLNVPFAVVYI